ncbi:aspartyl/asparaginyl beta-hydroxylase domain-containing protein [Pseudoalteromonas spongiae]|uniref:aspartyl/asparaginyl beta-hydroxylase domain-containing protein n=1 Tax=Pseudoalteromonas spongiae TaxID=298657 RepID=UPI00110A8150|nr:aspartyl/asparaginyl beta-hydroxylase domain-containing protein [Pseudoalteromonas spongiae]TMO83051.1 aspartyl beta-hydroxylase [Pseudoalteromonas spongiae]
MSECTLKINDRIKLPFSFDVVKMQQEFEALKSRHLTQYEYYDAIPLRAPAHIVDPSCPLPPPTDDYADGSWTDWLNTELLNSAPYLKSIVEFFNQHTKVNLVRILRLAPGEVVQEHTDPTLALDVAKSVVRLTIPIIDNPNVTFYLNNTAVPMQLGECWYLKLNDPHKVTNFGTQERVNLTIDIIPNQWLINTLAAKVISASV